MKKMMAMVQTQSTIIERQKNEITVKTATIKKLEQELELVSSDVVKIKSDLKSISSDAIKTKRELNDSEQYSRRNSIRLYNLPVPVEVKTERESDLLILLY